MKKHVKQMMWSVMAAMVLVATAGVAEAQTQAPSRAGQQAPTLKSPTVPMDQQPQQQPQTQAPATPRPQAGQVSFPKVDLKNFTADSPTTAEVDSFLRSMWGYDENRVWEVAAIQKTAAPGVARVVVFIADKTQPDKGTTSVFYTTPDGKHAIADKVMPFGAKPFVDNRTLMQAKADGPAHGAKGNDLMLVEFGDLQCAHCKDAQDTMKNLANDFPEAKIVFENYPLTEIHPYAALASAVGLCVRKQKGDDAFFTYAQNVFDKQADLVQATAIATLDAAATAAGADAKAAEACAVTQATKDELSAEVKLGNDVGVDQTPTLIINGYALPINLLPYSVLRRIVAYRANQDGVTVHLQPLLTTLK